MGIAHAAQAQSPIFVADKLVLARLELEQACVVVSIDAILTFCCPISTLWRRFRYSGSHAGEVNSYSAISKTKIRLERQNRLCNRGQRHSARTATPWMGSRGAAGYSTAALFSVAGF